MRILHILFLLFASITAGPVMAEEAEANDGLIEREILSETQSLIGDTIVAIEKAHADDEAFQLSCVEPSSRAFDESQRVFCARLLKAALPQFKELIADKSLVALKMTDTFDLPADSFQDESSNQVWFTGFDETEPIYFDLDALQKIGPEQLYFLMVRALGNKIRHGKQAMTIGDDSPVGPFEKGSEVLDAIASTLLKIAKNEEIISSNRFHVFDRFECSIQIEGVRFPQSKRSYSMLRMFEDWTRQGYHWYRTGVGQDGKITWFDPGIREQVVFQWDIFEKGGCGNKKGIHASEAVIWRESDEKVIFSETLDENPICNSEQRKIKIKFSHSTVECEYVESNVFVGRLGVFFGIRSP